MHVFSISKKGELEHRTDGELRATVPPEGWDDYCVHWPAAAEVVSGARSAAKSRAPVSDAAPAAKKSRRR